MQIGVVGLGKMGGRIAIKLQNDGHDVLAWNRSETAVKNLKILKTIKDLVESLEKPRVIWIMVPAVATDEVLSEISKFVEENDIVIDGGNSNFKDTERRSKSLMANGVFFLGIGVSGGILAFKNGYPLMAGGDKNAYKYIESVLKSLAKPNGGYDYFGQGGAGHFVKMVHNGIEYGMMQSIGEGFGVLEKAPYKFDLLKVAKIWQKGTVISGFLMDRTAEVFKNNVNDIAGVINATGEAEWTVEEAKKEGVPVGIIEESLEFRRKSQTNLQIQNSFAAKVVASLRNAFGGHKVKKK